MHSEGNLSAVKKLDFEEIQSLLKDELATVERSLKEHAGSSVAVIPIISGYLSNGGGKRLRPILVLITARLCGYNEGGGDITHSTVVEYIHAATLLHDDVVDEADIRRGIPSANAKWGNEYSVLVGDFLFAKSFSLMADHSPPGVVQAISEATKFLAEGEILELVHSADIDLTEKEYLNLIFRKTGALIKACCQVGGLLGGIRGEVTGRQMAALETYGENIGIAFQIIDDLLDFTADEKTLGKPVGQDLIEGHVTLPVIHAFANADEKEKIFIAETVKSRELSARRIGSIIELIGKYDSISYCKKMAENHIDKAVGELDCFPPNEYLDALKGLADYIINREM